MTREEWAEREAAEKASDARLLKWLRREVNRDLREWRGYLRAGTGGSVAGRLPGLVLDCKAKLNLIRWAESWQVAYEKDRYRDDDMRADMLALMQMSMHGVRKVAAGYSNREGWREEWVRQ